MFNAIQVSHGFVRVGLQNLWKSLPDTVNAKSMNTIIHVHVHVSTQSFIQWLDAWHPIHSAIIIYCTTLWYGIVAAILKKITVQCIC